LLTQTTNNHKIMNLILFFKRNSLLFTLALFASIQTFSQESKPLKTDKELLDLADRYIKTPILMIKKSNEEVFLQRDMSEYLSESSISKNIGKLSLSKGDGDHGHDHNDELQLEFLNRPHPSVATLEKYFDEAALTYKVPVEILKATAQVQSNWAQSAPSFYGSYGVMGLIENSFQKQISLASTLSNYTVIQIQQEAKANIFAAAALLAYYQKGYGKTNTVEDWFEATKDLTGLKEEELQASLALRFFEVIQNGSKTVSLWKEIITIKGLQVQLSKLGKQNAELPKKSTSKSTATSDYSGAIQNLTTVNFSSRPAGAIKYYFIHYIATGTYEGAISWFKNPDAQASSHYIVKNSNGEITQVVLESNKAWTQGVSEYNNYGIGVEHEVLSTNLSMWDSQQMQTALANLAIDVCNRNNIPKVRRANNGDKGIYGHNDVSSTTCPNLTPERWDAILSRITGGQITPTVSAPTLFSVINPGNGAVIQASWKTNTEPSLLGYRLYYATDDTMTQWALAADETSLSANTTSISLNQSQFKVVPTGNVHHFRLTAVVPNGANPVVESGASDVYSRSANTTGTKVLIVDAFDRASGSYTSNAHSFAASYFMGLRDKAQLQISTAANEKIEDDTVNLNDYQLVVWFVGDDSGVDLAFSTSEKNKIKNYLEAGGKMLISGSEIAYNVGNSSRAQYDLNFMNNYLKANYVDDGDETYTPATGIANSDFAGISIPFGEVYPEDYPDNISAVTGATNLLNYTGANKVGGVGYKGKFGAGTKDGGVVYISFPLETASKASIASFTEKMLQYLFGATLENKDFIADTIIQCYPNPFQNQLNLQLNLNSIGNIQVGLFDATGKLIESQDVKNSTNDSEIIFSTQALQSGMYFVKVTLPKGSSYTKKVIKE
jgi:hypothetical protein